MLEFVQERHWVNAERAPDLNNKAESNNKAGSE